MGKKSASAPDYEASAQAQGEANKQSAIQTSILSNPNVVNHLGSQTVNFRPTDSGVPQPFIRQKLSPTEQAKYDKGAALDIGLLDTAQGGLNRVDDMMGTPFDMSGISGVSSPDYSSSGPASWNQSNLPELSGGYEGNLPELTSLNAPQGADRSRSLGAPPSKYSGTFGQDPMGGGGNDMSTGGGGFNEGAGNGMTFGQNGQYQGGQQGQGGMKQGQGGNLDSNGLYEATGIDLSRLTQNGKLTQEGLQQVQALTQAGGPLQGIDLSQLGAQGSLNSQGLQGIDGVSTDGLDPYSTQAGVGGLQQVTDAIRSRGDIDFADKRQALDNDLRIRGFTPGSEGFRREMQGLERQQNDFNQQAILSGGQEQSRIAAMENARRQQGMSEQGQVYNSQMGQRNQQMSERGQVAQFAQQLRAQGLNEQQVQAQMANANRGQEFSERSTINQSQEQRNSAQFSQQESMAQFAQQLREQGLNEQQVQAEVSASQRGQQTDERRIQSELNLANRGQLFNEGQSQSETARRNRAQLFGENAQRSEFDAAESQRSFQNQNTKVNMEQAERARQIQEQAYLRQLPLNEINALRSGSQVNAPQFQQYTGAQVAPAPLFQAAQAQGNYDVAAGAGGDLMGGLFQLGSAAVGAGGIFSGGGGAAAGAATASDRRLKKNIKKLAKVGPLDLVSWTWNGLLGFAGDEVGFIAQQVQKYYPQFVVRMGNGYLGVDYEGLKHGIKL